MIEINIYHYDEQFATKSKAKSVLKIYVLYICDYKGLYYYRYN